jgi:hypothetical protein
MTHKNKIILNVLASNNSFTRTAAKLTELKKRKNKSTFIIKYFNILFLVINRNNREKNQ